MTVIFYEACVKGDAYKADVAQQAHCLLRTENYSKLSFDKLGIFAYCNPKPKVQLCKFTVNRTEEEVH